MIDEYICPTAREDGQNSIEDLINICLKDFTENADDDDDGAGAIEMKTIQRQQGTAGSPPTGYSMADRQYAQNVSAV